MHSNCKMINGLCPPYDQFHTPERRDGQTKFVKYALKYIVNVMYEDRICIPRKLSTVANFKFNIIGFCLPFKRLTTPLALEPCRSLARLVLQMKSKRY